METTTQTRTLGFTSVDKWLLCFNCFQTQQRNSHISIRTKTRKTEGIRST